MEREMKTSTKAFLIGAGINALVTFTAMQIAAELGFSGAGILVTGAIASIACWEWLARKIASIQ